MIIIPHMPNPEPIQIRQGAYLPHWTREGASYFVTFRTADSLPRHAVEKLKSELRIIERKTHWDDLTPEDLARLGRLKSDAYLNLLDNCYGECVLRRDDCAKVVADSLLQFGEVRYRLWAWCVMPNHVHVVVKPFESFGLPDILKGWKSFTSRQINRILNQSGVFWQSEYYDHLIRDEAEFRRYVSYTMENPAKANLVDWKWVGRHEE